MNRNPLSQLASIGEEVLDKAAQNPTAARVIQGATQVRDRVDDLGKRVRGLESMEQRLAELEARLAKLEHKPVAAKPKASAAKKPAGDEPD